MAPPIAVIAAPPVHTTSAIALKEWAVICRALGAGDQIASSSGRAASATPRRASASSIASSSSSRLVRARGAADDLVDRARPALLREGRPGGADSGGTPARALRRRSRPWRRSRRSSPCVELGARPSRHVADGRARTRPCHPAARRSSTPAWRRSRPIPARGGGRTAPRGGRHGRRPAAGTNGRLHSAVHHGARSDAVTMTGAPGRPRR